MALDDPAYVACWGPYVDEQNPVATRQYGYVNLILTYWESRYELGTFTDATLRLAAREMFASPPGRVFWADARDDRAKTHQTRKERRFHAIVDEEYQRAIERTPVLSSPAPPVRRRGNAGQVTCLAAGLAGAAVLGWWIARRRR